MSQRYKKLTILHSNDIHGDIQAEQKKSMEEGGFAYLSGYISKVKAEEPNTLYAIAGDMFVGSLIDSEYMGLSTISALNALNPDIATVGNHEVDYGIGHLAFIEKCANFPIINANIHIKSFNTRLFQPYKIIEVDGMKILFIGIITQDVMISAKNQGILGTYVDIWDAAKDVERIINGFKSQDIDLTVLLTHIGWAEDHELAKILNPDLGVDIIIGGHSHTYIEKPDFVNGIYIVQAGAGTDQVGRFDLLVDTEENKVAEYKWELVPVNSNTCEKDPVMEELVRNMADPTDNKYAKILTRLNGPLENDNKYKRQTAMGSFYSDILKDCLSLDMMLLGAGTLRKDVVGPVITQKDLVESYGYCSCVYTLKATGFQLKKMFTFVLKSAVDHDLGQFYQLSKGMKILYSKSQEKILSFTFNGKEILDTELYSIGLQKFHYNNFDESFGTERKELEKNHKPIIVCTSDQDAMIEYLLENPKKYRAVHENRIEMVD